MALDANLVNAVGTGARLCWNRNNVFNFEPKKKQVSTSLYFLFRQFVSCAGHARCGGPGVCTAGHRGSQPREARKQRQPFAAYNLALRKQYLEDLLAVLPGFRSTPRRQRRRLEGCPDTAPRDFAWIHWHIGPGGFQGQGHWNASDAGAWVSYSGSRRTACDPHALGGPLCGEQRGPDDKNSTTQHARRIGDRRESQSGGLGKKQQSLAAYNFTFRTLYIVVSCHAAHNIRSRLLCDTEQFVASYEPRGKRPT